MEILNIGVGELLIVLIIALLVFGPERLPEMVRQTMRVVAQLRGATDEIMRVLTTETEPIRQVMEETKDEITSTARPLHEARDDLQNAATPLRQAHKELNDGVKAAQQAYKQPLNTVRRLGPSEQATQPEAQHQERSIEQPVQPGSANGVAEEEVPDGRTG